MCYISLYFSQEPKDEKDEEHCRKVNDFLNNPPPQSNGGGSNTRNSNISAALQGLPESDMQGLLGNINQNDLMQLLGEFFITIKFFVLMILKVL